MKPSSGLNAGKTIPEKIGKLLENFEIKNALNEIISFAREGNIYINDNKPTKTGMILVKKGDLVISGINVDTVAKVP